jgi:hypothetical protein
MLRPSNRLLLLRHLALRTFLVTVAAGCAGEAAKNLEPVAAADPTGAGDSQRSSEDESNDDASPEPPGRDASPKTEAGDGATAASCKDLDTSMLPYEPISSEPGPPPSLEGGAIVQGTYTLTGARSYVAIGNPPPPDPLRRGSLEIGASQMTIATEPGPGTAHSATVAYTVVADGLSVIPQCFVLHSGAVEHTPNEPARVIAYAATPTTFILRTIGTVTMTTNSNGTTVVTDESVEDYTFTR